jgi:hypothetical protein
VSPFVETLKRTYKNGKIDLAKVDELKLFEKITLEEYEYIVSQ